MIWGIMYGSGYVPVKVQLLVSYIIGSFQLFERFLMVFNNNLLKVC